MTDLKVRPSVLVSLKIPTDGKEVQELAATCDVKFNDGPVIMTRDDLLKSVSGVDALMCTTEDICDRELLEKAGKTVVIFTNFIMPVVRKLS